MAIKMLHSKLFVPSTPKNIHLDKVKEFFGQIPYDTAAISKDIQFVFQCYTNRSGSNYLAELLASGNQLPTAGENLNFDTIINHSQRLNLTSLQDYIAFLVGHTSKNRYVSIKIAPAHLELLNVSGILDQIIDRSHFIVVERSDKLSQAISHVIAFQTGRFTSYMEGNNTDPKFDRDQINNVISGIADAYRIFSVFFARNGLIPCHINYEQFANNPAQFFPIIGEFIGIPDINVDLSRVRTAKQSNHLNAEWRKLYLENTSTDHPPLS